MSDVKVIHGVPYDSEVLREELTSSGTPLRQDWAATPHTHPTGRRLRLTSDFWLSGGIEMSPGWGSPDI